MLSVRSLIFFRSTAKPSLVNISATCTLVTEPKIFPFSPTFAGTLNVFLVNLASVAVASSRIFSFLIANNIIYTC